MSYYVLEPPRRGRIGASMLVLAVAGLVALTLAAWTTADRPFRVVADGVEVSVAPGTTVADLQRAGRLAPQSGDLIGVDGSVVATGAGTAGRVLRDGRIADETQRLYRGDILSSTRGADRRETLVEVERAVPYVTEYQGSGSVHEIVRQGKDGLRRVTMGAVSGSEVTSTVVAKPLSALVIRHSFAPGAKIVALTFDDGPWPFSTNRILDVLKREEVPATFFLLGQQAKRYPDTAKRVVADGHQVANHTFGHRVLSALGPAGARRQISDGRKAIAGATGVDSRWLRPPYGAMDGPAWKQARLVGSRVVGWDVDSRDWTRPGAERIELRVIADVSPGAVVLLHDGGGDRRQTLEALPRIIRRLRKAGYSFVTVEEMARARSSAMTSPIVPRVKAKPAVNRGGAER